MYYFGNQQDVERIRKIHLIGIGGAGMAGIAEVLINMGFEVSGSDLQDNRATKHLVELGANISFEHSPKNIVGVDVLVLSSAIDPKNSELKAAQEARIPIVPRAEMLAELMRFHFGITIAGTHGKTTTTSLIASILAEGGLDPTFVIGGLLNSAGSNARLGESRYFVVEADESDASFLHLKSMMTVVTNIEAEHMTHYEGDFSRLKNTFNQFIHNLPFYGLAVLCHDDPVIRKMLKKISRPIITYGFDKNADVRAIDVEQSGTQTRFKILRPNTKKPLDILLNLPGAHNVLNATAALTIATELGVKDAAIKKALKEFAGIARRFEIYNEITIAGKNVTMVDDYGHHPTEVGVTIKAARDAWPGRRLVMIYQPHRYTRTKDLFEDFTRVLSKVDELLLLDVYSAGEKRIPGADSRTLCGSIRHRGSVEPIHVEDNEGLSDILKRVLRDNDVLLTQGAGTISSIVSKLIGESQ